MPDFVFGTDGQDAFDDIIVHDETNGDATYGHRICRKENGAKYINGDDIPTYDKGEIIRCILRVKSEDGFRGADQSFSLSVRGIADSATSFLIFPEKHQPENLRCTYRGVKDQKWRAMKQGIHELRRFPRNRKAYVLEVQSPPAGHEYQIMWSWDWV
jgi:hypothetical protein